jgi:hypothetical protein
MNWIPIDERRPSDGRKVIVWIDRPMMDVDMAWHSEDGDWFPMEYKGYGGSITHWMELPQGPGEAE